VKVTSNRQPWNQIQSFRSPNRQNAFASVRFCYRHHGQQPQSTHKAAGKASLSHSHCALIISFSAFPQQLLDSFFIVQLSIALPRTIVLRWPRSPVLDPPFVLIQGAFTFSFAVAFAVAFAIAFAVAVLSHMLPRSSLSLVPKFAMVSQDIAFLVTCCLLSI